jgi:nucleoside-diphosphate-sugar epimerase
MVRALNVQGAREIIELGRNAKKLRAIVHHSSTAVAGDRRGVVREDELESGQKFASPIAQTLYHAERLMRRASASLPVIVLRPGMLVGHSVTGEIDRLDGPYLLILLILTSPVEVPLPVSGNAPLQLVPVDYVARSAVALMDDPRAVGRTFHLVDPSPLPARRVYELVATTAGRRLPRGFIPVNISRALLRTPGLERFVKSPRAFLEQMATPVAFDTHNARELLAPRGIECPPFTSYVDTMVTFVRERLAARRAEQQSDESVAETIDDPLG